MKNKIVLLVASFGIVLGVTVIYLGNASSSRSKLNVSSIDKNGIYVGNGQSGLEPASDGASKYAQTVKGLNEGWDNIGVGNSYFQSGQYEKAAEAYKKAYEVDPGNRIFSGKKLIEAYERLSQYDEALAVVDEILKTQPLVEVGVKRFEAIRARLLAAKSQSSEAT